MTNKIIILGVLLFSLGSCYINQKENIEVSIIEVEKTSLNKYQEDILKGHICISSNVYEGEEGD